MTENQTWLKLKLFCKRHDIAASRIENAITSGMFDTELSWDNTTLWIELKADPRKELRITQRAWARQRYIAGCKNDMFILYPTFTIGYAIIPVSFILERESSVIGSDHAMVFPSMDDLVVFLKGNWRTAWTL